MNAHSTTARDLANALMGKRRTAQSVHVSTAIFNGSPLGPKYIVLVVPEGQTTGEYFEVWQRGLDALRDGMSPEELELDPYEPEPEDDASGIPHPDDLLWDYHSRVRGRALTPFKSRTRT